MYARKVEGRELSFGVSGMLIEDSLLMYDRQTGSLWPQVDGRAIQGPLEGKTLRLIGSSLLTWKEWKKIHPDTLVLKAGEKARGSSYQAYSRDPNVMGLGHTELRDHRLAGKEKVLGVRAGGESMVFPLRVLNKRGLAAARVGGLPVVVLFSRKSGSAVAFLARASEGRELSFHDLRERDDKLVMQDRETGSTWLALSGEAVEGPLKGQRLEPATAIMAYWYAWQNFFPRSPIWKGN